MSMTRALGRKDYGVISYSVHEPPSPPADRVDRATSLVFVREGLVYTAAAITPIWLIAKRQWLALVLYLVAVAVIVGVLVLVDAPPMWFLVASSALHLLIGFEADTIQRWTLGRQGYRMVGTVTGRTEVECERRFFESWLPQQPMLAPRTGSTATHGTLAAGAEHLLSGDDSLGEAVRSRLAFWRR